ncbi:MAG: peptidylprolyl isomerase [Algibacter sp.]|uniref:peptidylprolyl isomerase n=1 Tax=Algibacter sp. TaxID=1872428 RepID=UPI002608D3FE|nr:peptidylprolyl isomerase [Algibacter sp.]MDG1730281.1 peptidylprolyl isomerase [Algibacter sp.]MDG2178909.1 peptidylprolyl isomerase [Algibacter sp.]
MFLKSNIRVLLLLLVISLNACKAQYPELEDGLYAEFITSKGVMVAKLEQEKAPITVANFVSLAEGTNTMVKEKYKKKKFYNGLIFHRVMDKFMIQGGDPLGTGQGNPGYKFKNEFHPDLKHDRPGILSMANSGPNTNGSQFFITEIPKPHLDNNYNVFGSLVIGLNIQDSISNVETDNRNRPLKDVVIEALHIIRKGRSAKQFDAPNVFENHFAVAERLEKEKKTKAAATLKATQDKFKKQKAEAITLDSGLQYYISEKGTGEDLKENSEVLTDYTVYFENGKLLETSKLEVAEQLDAVNEKRKAANRYQPIIANIGPDAQMVSGFKEGLQQLNVGDKATLFIPYHLAYGEAGRRGIPGKSNIIFEVEILELIK